MNRRIVQIVIGIAALLLLGLGAAWSVRQFGSSEKAVPVTRVQRGNLELDIRTTGELRTPHSSTLVAPSVNGTLQIIYIARTGTTVKAGDVVVEFDPSEQEYNLAQSRSQMEEAEQEIVKARADASVKEAEDKVALLKARFDVRRAELEVGRNELLGDIDARKNILILEQARRHLEQLQQDLASRAQSSASGLALLEEKRKTAMLAMNAAQRNIDNMKVKAPMDGLVTVKDNMDAGGGMMFPGMTLPEYHEGDLVFPGRFLAEVLDVSQMVVVARVLETDRPNLNQDQETEIRTDAEPESALPARVKHIAGMTVRSDFDSSSVRRFEVSFELLNRATGLRPGTTAQILVRGNQLKDQLYLPSQCLFEKDGKLVVYVKHGSKFEPVEAKIKLRTENRVAIENLKEGAEVALVDPVQFQKQQQTAPSSSPLGVGR